jgi:fatty-acyl-CoA synthase
LSVVPLNTWSRSGELAAVARRARLRAVIVDGDAPLESQGDLDVFASDDAARSFVRAFAWSRHDALPASLPAGSATDTARLSAATTTEDAEALLLFTSGSSAEPKAVPLTQVGIVTNAHAVGERQGVVPGDRFWLASPLFFVFGCANALPNALTNAAPLCVQERFDPSRALEFIERHRCTVTTRSHRSCVRWQRVRSCRSETSRHCVPGPPTPHQTTCAWPSTCSACTRSATRTA